MTQNKIIINNHISVPVYHPRRKRKTNWTTADKGYSGIKSSSDHMTPSIQYDNRFSNGSGGEINRELYKQLAYNNDRMSNNSALNENDKRLTDLRLEFAPQFERINQMFGQGYQKFRQLDNKISSIYGDDAGNLAATQGSDNFHAEGTNHPADVYAQPTDIEFGVDKVYNEPYSQFMEEMPEEPEPEYEDIDD